MVIPLTHQHLITVIQLAWQGATPPRCFPPQADNIPSSPYEGEGAMAGHFTTSALFACKKVVC